MEFLVGLAEGFIGMFQEGGEVFMGLVTGIIPTLICLITAVNAIIKMVGEERINRFAMKCTKNIILRYSVFPVLAVFFLTNPMAYTFGRFLPEKQKPAFYDSAVSFVHPVTGLFPHANPAELFVYMGIAAGITELGLSLGPLAIRFFLVGILVILIRGIVTEFLTVRMMKAKGMDVDQGSVKA
ncbi:PTS glucitol/sorbitol transporter subunit IIC [Halalkalibacterium halodurans]|jgi:PTS system glucitol/sorbitol-specific IIC component|uniref:PTS system, glucitol/sorbitol-specific enzyme II, C2 component (Permease) n=2 Tax=Halalkalibacterium halodurans TaxID=86665 RepID=Q9KES8_HALH5|nr:PTS glucitol/sorbitol transporter subunit IIC [Halalkalibacterium halodurans]MDY7221273.1 PTS glucitol/sorbitol transporter subunit IIC [Halalkalibacterium halodurans]MDY7240512.1 PTS glucitol/sorbitol transporter subunit IIC [Halalkalibacterium halodurans]MED4081454.1 PTS glucitol/sorbitol transporter subunit IIC [Halalkalibacterium halodurans]MED4083264.1 PTS glucitol/sorbitol transporter subunit IIC [Halalkalibacterium halodurans]MED4106545.1 PTS glucitol/sorbitol transporter subunit IIC